MQSVFLDTNIILRFLLQDYPPHKTRVNRLFQAINDGQLIGIVTPVVIAELYWTLTGPKINVPRPQVSRTLTQFLLTKNIHCEHQASVVAALKILEAKNLDFADVYSYSRAKHTQKQIASFDTDFDTLDFTIRYKP